MQPVIAGYAAPSYAAQAPHGAVPNPREDVVSFGSWVGTFILLSIPLVNVILLLVWAISSDTNRNRQNFARAVILLGILTSILYGVLFAIAALIGMRFMP